MKVVNCTKCNEEYAIDLNKPEEWYCPYCDNLYSFTTDKLSVEKLQERCDRYKKALTEISDGTMELSIDDFNASSKASVEAMYAEQALTAIGGDDEKV